jgi:Tfp pilus assembly protein PilF
MGNIHKKKHDYEKAVQYLTAAVDSESGPYVLRTRYNLVLCLLNNHQEEKALSYLNRFLATQKYDSRFMTAKGFLLLRRAENDSALQYLRPVFRHNPNDKDVLLTMAMTLSAEGAYQRADWYLKRARKRYPDNLIVHLALLQNAIAMKDAVRIDDYLFQITNRFRINNIKQFFIEHAEGRNYIDGTLVPVEDRIVIPYLTDYLERSAQKLTSE